MLETILPGTRVFIVSEDTERIFQTIHLLDKAGYEVGYAELGNNTIRHILDFGPAYLIIPHASVVIDMETMAVKYAVGESLAETVGTLLPEIKIIFYGSPGERPYIFSRSLKNCQSIFDPAYFNLRALRHDMGYH